MFKKDPYSDKAPSVSEQIFIGADSALSFKVIIWEFHLFHKLLRNLVMLI